MTERLKKLQIRFHNLKKELAGLQAASDPAKYKELSRLSRINDLSKSYETCLQELSAAQKMAETEQDLELKNLASDEVKIKTRQLKELEDQLLLQLVKQDPDDHKNIILEIRAGAGGREAALFAAELFGAYRQYALRKGWRLDVISLSPSEDGGFKEIISNICGKGVYRIFKYESGVHRVQRVPKTETQGRIHTSTVTAVALAEVRPVELKISPAELRIDVCRAGGAGGQHINTTDSAVRITHLPTKIMVYCQQERSQHANKEKAMKILLARLKDFQKEKARAARSKTRLKHIAGGDRSMKIRTYNFPQSRLTDHRALFTQKNLSAFMAGDMDSLFSALILHSQKKALREAAPCDSENQERGE